MVKYALLIEKIYDTYKVVAKLRLIEKAGGLIVSFQKRTYVVDPKVPTWTQFLKKFFKTEYQEIYAIDIGSESGQLIWNKAIQPMNASDLDQMMASHILRELAAGVSAGKEKMINAIIGFVMGALICGICLVMYYTNLIQTMQQQIIEQLADQNINFPSFEL